MPEYKFPNGATRYGADMGRRSHHSEPRAHVGSKLRLFKVALDTGGYDNGGAYWGTGEPLWCCMGESLHGDRIEFYLRAKDRDAAKDRVRNEFGYNSCRFYGPRSVR